MDVKEVKVVSEINTFLISAGGTVKPVACDKNRVAKLSFSVPKNEDVDKKQLIDKASEQAQVDEDGDLILRRKTDNLDLEELSLLIEYENSTSLDKVGLQVWRGAFLLADFVIHYKNEYFKDKHVLELGSGTGLTSIVASMFSQHVTATDIDDPAILKLLEINAKVHNKHFINADYQVCSLDFLELDQWSENLTDNVAKCNVILAADVVYHVNITTAFVKTLKKLITTGSNSKDIFIAMEKRYVFTVADVDTVAPMYAHFMDELENILNIYPGCLEKQVGADENGTKYLISMQFVPIDFPQYFAYERTPQLVLLHVKSRVK